MGMLYQIERKLAGLKKEIEMQEKDAVDVKSRSKGGSKVVAIDVDPETYNRLREVAIKHNVRGIRGALLLAAKTGLRHL